MLEALRRRTMQQSRLLQLSRLLAFSARPLGYVVTAVLVLLLARQLSSAGLIQALSLLAVGALLLRPLSRAISTPIRLLAARLAMWASNRDFDRIR